MPSAPLSLFREHLRHPEICALYGHWVGHCGDFDVPHQEFFATAEMLRWAGDLVIMKVRERGFSYAFYGQSFKQAFGVDMTGADTEHLPRGQAAILNAEYRQVVEQRRPSWRVYTAWFEDNLQTWERVTLPLADYNQAEAERQGPITLLLTAAYRLPDTKPPPASLRALR
jgi:hypothetical protein